MSSEGVKVKLRFEGQQHQMELDTLIFSLINFAELTKAAAQEVAPGEIIQVKINATEKGSFEVLLELCTEIAEGLLQYISNDSLQKVSSVMGVVLGAINLKKVLKGKKPDSFTTAEGKTEITFQDSKIIVAENVFNFYGSNIKANSHIESLFDKLSESPQIEGITFDADGQEAVTIESKDFPGMSQKNELTQKEEKVKVVETDLSIIKLVFQKNRKWEFIYQGNKISAVVVDEGFWNKVDSFGVRFGKGDFLVVKLEITQIFDKDVNAYLNKSYRVLEISSYKQAPQQIQIDFLDN